VRNELGDRARKLVACAANVSKTQESSETIGMIAVVGVGVDTHGAEKFGHPSFFDG
jgi:hypothetical protein